MTRSVAILTFAVVAALSLPGTATARAGVEARHGATAHHLQFSPEVNITEPKDGAEVAGDHFTLKYEVSNFTLDASAIGGANRPGEGHVHVAVDGIEVAATASTSVPITGLQPGKRTVKVALHNNDHSPLDPEVGDEIEVEVPGPHLSVGSPAQGARVDSFEVEIEFEVEHFVLERPSGQANADGHGHIRWRVLRDGAVVTKDPEVLWKVAHAAVELKEPGCGSATCVYTLEAWLANNDGSAVAGVQRLSVEFSVLPPDYLPVLAFGFTMLGLIALGMLWAVRRRPGEAAARKDEEKVEGLSEST